VIELTMVPRDLYYHEVAYVRQLEAALALYADDKNWKFNGRFDPNSYRFDGVTTAATALVRKR